jgi:carbon-monoxide dehydrogenase medium subunit
MVYIYRVESIGKQVGDKVMAEMIYQSPKSIEEAVNLLAASSGSVNILAGGTDLIIQMQASIDAPRVIIDVKKIAEMTQAELTDDGLLLGPSMCCAELTAREDIKALFPGLVESAYLIGSSQVQGRASVGGNLCNSSPAADTVPALIALNASCQILGPAGERTVKAEDFVTGVGSNCLAEDEFLRCIEIPRPAPNSADAYLRFIPRTEMDIAVAGAAVSLTVKEGLCSSARVAIGAVAPTALLVPEAAACLVGTDLGTADLNAAAAAATAAATPITDRRGTVEFRKHIVGVLTKRAASIAFQRAKGN